jgi:hypothetical protein
LPSGSPEMTLTFGLLVGYSLQKKNTISLLSPVTLRIKLIPQHWAFVLGKKKKSQLYYKKTVSIPPYKLRRAR